MGNRVIGLGDHLDCEVTGCDDRSLTRRSAMARFSEAQMEISDCVTLSPSLLIVLMRLLERSRYRTNKRSLVLVLDSFGNLGIRSNVPLE
jgi:hypothetical protein